MIYFKLRLIIILNVAINFPISNILEILLWIHSTISNSIY
nr:MAG TPA: hypothetical protein [Caudoviricetes sp.]